MAKSVVVYAFPRTTKKTSFVYKIKVLDDSNEVYGIQEIINCKSNDFTVNPGVAMFIAHSEAKKLGQDTFTVYFGDEVADFSELKKTKKEAKESKKNKDQKN